MDALTNADIAFRFLGIVSLDYVKVMGILVNHYCGRVHFGSSCGGTCTRVYCVATSCDIATCPSLATYLSGVRISINRLLRLANAAVNACVSV